MSVQYIRNLSIKKKLNFIVMLTTGAALILAFAGFIAYAIFTTRLDMARNLSIMAESVANNSSAALSFNDPKYANEALAVFKANPHIHRAVIYDQQGKIFATYVGSTSDEPLVRPNPHPFDARFENDHLIV